MANTLKTGLQGHLIQFLDNLNIPLTGAERSTEILDIPAI